MLTLYGVYRSRASRSLWLLHEIGLPFTHIPVIQAYRLADAGAADAALNTASPAFLAVNPMGQIPAMVEDGLLLTESMAITLYIAQRHGDTFGPKDTREAALISNWAFFAATSVEAAALAILQSPAGDDAAVSAAAGKLARPLAHVESHLQGRDWLLDRFTAADICLAECLRYASGNTALMAAHPVATAWLARCHARPAFQAMFAARHAEPA